MHCIHTAEDIIKLLSQPSSPIILVFLIPAPVPNSKGNHFSWVSCSLTVHWSIHFGRLLPKENRNRAVGCTGVRELMTGLATPEVDPGAFSGQRQGCTTPNRTLWQCTASVCVAGVHFWEISLGLADPWNVIFCLSCWFILGFSCVYSLCIVS